MKLPIRAAGLPWFEPETFDQVKALMEDRDRLHRSYAEWLIDAERTEDQLRRRGDLVVRAYLRPDEFPQWCRANGHDVDAQGRT